MTGRVVGVLHYPRGEDYGYGRLPHKRPRRIYWRTLWWKSNPRPAPYMRELFAERYPDGELHEGTSPPAADTTVLLYADSIGLGFAPLERQLAGRRLRALNGRRRDFELDAPTRRALRVRRVLERTMLFEAVALPLFFLLAIPLALFDAVRGRR
jgi:hypothetical protein